MSAADWSEGNWISMNSLWPSDAIWWYRSGSTLAQTMACCPMSPSHFLNQCWFITRGQFWPLGIVIACVYGSVCPCVCVYQSRACPHDNSSPIQAQITKFGPEMQNTLVWVPIVFGDDWPWSSRSNLTWKSNFTPFWACSHHYQGCQVVRNFLIL